MTKGWQPITQPQSFSARLATWSSRHRYVVIAAWLCVSLVGAALWVFVGTDTDIEQPPRGEAGEALQLFEERFGRDGAPVREFVVISHDSSRVRDDHFEEAAGALISELAGLRTESNTGGDVPTRKSLRVVASIKSYEPGADPDSASPDEKERLENLARLLVSSDPDGGDTTFFVVALEGDLEQAKRNVPLVVDAVGGFYEDNLRRTNDDLQSAYARFCELALSLDPMERVCNPFNALLGEANERIIRDRLPREFPVGEPALVSAAEELLATNEAFKSVRGFDFEIGGEASLADQVADLVDSDYNRSLYLDFAIAFIILTLIFGALISASIPLLMAVFAIVASSGCLALISRAFPMSQLHLEIVLLLGLAMGIDYALFVMNRYRSEVALGRPRDDALRIACGTAGKTVVFAGATVVLGAAGMFIVDDVLFNSVAIAVMVTVALTMVLSLTLLPALIASLDVHLDRYRLPLIRPVTEEGGGVWGRLTGRVLERPKMFAAATFVFLAVLATPLFFPQFNLGFNGFRAVSDEAAAKVALGTLAEKFDVGTALPAPLVIDFSPGRVFGDSSGQVDRLTDFLESESELDDDKRAFGEIVEDIDTNATGDTQRLLVPLAADIGEDKAVKAIAELRSEIADIFDGEGPRVLVTGPTAINVDFRDNIVFKTPFVFAYVFFVAFLILMVMFRSVVIPIQAILLNALVVAAAYGVIVLVFQEGWALERLLDFEATGIVDSWIPLLIFAVLFSVSMNYHLFIMGRIKEAYERGASIDEAIAIGVKATAGTVTGAAAIMVTVLVVLAFSRSIGLKELGVGLGVAVLIDATLIRSVLLPASMKLLGDFNWYLPRWLAWIPGVRMGES